MGRQYWSKLHEKAFSVANCGIHRLVQFDPRSSTLNTENGLCHRQPGV